jgi:hypothetical protein
MQVNINVVVDRAELACKTHGLVKGETGMGRVAGKVAFITGAARGQGHAHAVRLAQRITGLTLTVDAGLASK